VKLKPGQTYSTTGTLEQSCRGKDDPVWDDWYLPTTDVGLTLRAHHYQSSSQYYRCYYDGRACGNEAGCTANGNDNGYFVTRHSSSYYDICGRSDTCDAGTHVVIMFGPEAS
jgi:hypothetical protein